MIKIRGKPKTGVDLDNVSEGDIVTLSSGVEYQITDDNWLVPDFGLCVVAVAVNPVCDGMERLFKKSTGEHIYGELGKIASIRRIK